MKVFFNVILLLVYMFVCLFVSAAGYWTMESAIMFHVPQKITNFTIISHSDNKEDQ